jgi:diaminopimelate decarboxylase
MNSVSLSPEIVFTEPTLLTSRFGCDTFPETNTFTRGYHFHLGRTIDHSNNPHQICFDALPETQYIDVGGSWHRVDDLNNYMKTLVQKRPNTKLIFELGRIMSINSISLETVITKIKYSNNIVNIYSSGSNECHAKWADSLTTNLPKGTALTKISGSTCYEKDVFCINSFDLSNVKEGQTLCFSGLNGYCIAWNTSFNGVPKADIIIE